MADQYKTKQKGKSVKLSAADEQRCMEELKQRMLKVPPLPDEPNFATETETLKRFLVARDYRVDDAEKLLTATTEWRRDVKPHLADCRWCHERPGFHCMRQVGFDKQQRPVIYSCFAQQVTRKNLVEDTVAHCTYLMENAIKTMTGDVSKVVWVIDCTGMTLACCNPKLGYGCGQVFANFYPERLGLVICINHNPVFQGVWKAIKGFLDPKTAAKVQLSRSKEKVNEYFKEAFSPELCKWLREEIDLNKQKKISPTQKRFWECPPDPNTHDPRGSLSYVMNYIEPYIAYCRAPERQTRSVHKPHPNVVDKLQGDVKEYQEPSPIEEQPPFTLSDVTNNGDGDACAELDIPDEYKIDPNDATVDIADHVVTRM